MTRHWYEEFANRFCQVALLNAIMFPISCANPIRAHLVLAREVCQHAASLNQLYIPPEYLLSERSGLFAGALVYTFIFGSGMPLLYVFMMFMCVAFYIIDRVMLFHLAGNLEVHRKLSSLLIHVMPAGVLLHFTIAVWIFGERDFPSYVLSEARVASGILGSSTWTASRMCSLGSCASTGLCPRLPHPLCCPFHRGLLRGGWWIYQQRKRGGRNEEMEGVSTR